MSDNKNAKVSPFVEVKDLFSFEKSDSNLYNTIVIIAKRANQINSVVNEELHEKLQEFGSTTDDLEEIHENVEQIEISKFYEKLPKPTLIATQEFLEDKTYVRKPDEENSNEDVA